MGYSPWDLKESENTERTRHAEVTNFIFKCNESSVCETAQKKEALS